MDDYNKNKELKSQFISLVLDIEQNINHCVESNKNESNLELRINNIENCIKNKCSKKIEEINNFKIQHNLKSEDHWTAVNEISNKVSEESLEKFKQEFPLSNNSIWKQYFEHNYKLSGNYRKSYFDANDYLLYSNHSKLLRTSCMNSNTFGGEGLVADDLIKCINRTKKILSGNK